MWWFPERHLAVKFSRHLVGGAQGRPLLQVLTGRKTDRPNGNCTARDSQACPGPIQRPLPEGEMQPTQGVCDPGLPDCPVCQPQAPAPQAKEGKRGPQTLGWTSEPSQVQALPRGTVSHGLRLRWPHLYLQVQDGIPCVLYRQEPHHPL
uniref:SPARC (Osteonectin), cwcv and kazal like domains proteoglycan 1 n=1 Tax=Molossus molossus TaxID=27622 RepID=A0A7J8ICD2_MOLMO|nr:SPARC (osteonectin), cwcv and kazal like domains proteoglycan 1 [Molossus molossus]